MTSWHYKLVKITTVIRNNYGPTISRSSTNPLIVILTAAVLSQGKERGNGAVERSRGAGMPGDLHGLEQLEGRCIVLTSAPGG